MPQFNTDTFGTMPNSQVNVLMRLLGLVARPGMMVLEIGSWTGHSTSRLARMVNVHQGKVVCVDWWKGNPSIPQMDQDAKDHNVFNLFLENMKELGLEDVVIPIKSESGVAANFLRDEFFDFVFIDADHAYDSVKRDIICYLPKVRLGGILAGHDCETWLTEDNKEFLVKNRNADLVEGVHPGVTLAVARLIPDAEVDTGIWYRTITKEVRDSFSQRVSDTIKLFT
jgi:predicted O-methyltransferase YrrM